MTHDKMINCWKLYLFAFITTRTGSAIEGDSTTNPPEACAAVALGVHHGSIKDGTAGPLAFKSFSNILNAQINGVDIGTIDECAEAKSRVASFETEVRSRMESMRNLGSP